MTGKTRLEQLGKLNIFSQLTKSQLQTFDEFFTEENIGKDTVFIEQEENSDKAYLIIEGAVRVYRVTEDGEEVTVAFKGSGELIGEMALLDGKPRSAYVKTIKHTLFYTLSRENFINIILKNPQIALNVIKSLTQSIRNMDQLLENNKSKNLYERTFATLQSLAIYFNNNDIAYSQEELASIVGATRSRVTEVLHDLQKNRKIIITHRKIHLL